MNHISDDQLATMFEVEELEDRLEMALWGRPKSMVSDKTGWCTITDENGAIIDSYPCHRGIFIDPGGAPPCNVDGCDISGLHIVSEHFVGAQPPGQSVREIIHETGLIVDEHIIKYVEAVVGKGK